MRQHRAEAAGSSLVASKPFLAGPDRCRCRWACCAACMSLAGFSDGKALAGCFRSAIGRTPHWPAAKPGDSCRTSGRLSTEKDMPGQLFAQAAQRQNSCGTGLSLRQMRAALAENGLVHRKAASLLLPLCIHRTIKEQPGTTGACASVPARAGVLGRFSY